jgi:hypothetical protein
MPPEENQKYRFGPAFARKVGCWGMVATHKDLLCETPVFVDFWNLGQA